jgi:hypothetical protein
MEALQSSPESLAFINAWATQALCPECRTPLDFVSLHAGGCKWERRLYEGMQNSVPQDHGEAMPMNIETPKFWMNSGLFW